MSWTLVNTNWAGSGTTKTLTMTYVQAERSNLDSGLMVLPIPQTAPGNAFLFDLTGSQERITIEGVETFTSLANAQTWLGSSATPSNGTFRSLVNGRQNTRYTYNSDLLGAIPVKVLDATASVEAGVPYSIIRYTITLILGAT